MRKITEESGIFDAQNDLTLTAFCWEPDCCFLSCYLMDLGIISQKSNTLLNLTSVNDLALSVGHVEVTLRSSLKNKKIR